MNRDHKKTNNSTNMKAMDSPPGSLRSYIQRQAAMTRISGFEAILLRNGPDLHFRTCPVLTGAAGNNGAMKLQLTNMGSNSTSCPS